MTRSQRESLAAVDYLPEDVEARLVDHPEHIRWGLAVERRDKEVLATTELLGPDGRHHSHTVSLATRGERH